MSEAYIQPAPYRTDKTVKSDLNRLMLLVDDTQIPIAGQAMYGIPRGWGGTCRGFCITDQITDQYAPYCSELRYAVSSDYIELADYWWMQQEMNTLSVRHTNKLNNCLYLII